MAIVNFKTPFKRAKDFKALVNNLDVVIREIQKVILYGTYIDATIPTGGIELAHKLQREPQGWIIVDKDVNSSVWRYKASDSKSLYLKSDVEVNVKIYIW